MKVLVTGCAGGIGQATALLLAQRGHTPIATARDPRRIQLPAEIDRLRLDVTDAESIDDAVSAAGELDGIVNNAGVGIRGPVEAFSLADVQAAYSVNVFGALSVTQAVLPQFRRQGHGVVVSMSSVAGRRSMPLTGHYAATKHALEAMMESLRYEVASFGVRVVLIEPAGVSTGFFGRRIEPADTPVTADYRNVTSAADAMMREAQLAVVTPEEVAATILDALLSPDPPLRWPVAPVAASLLAERHRTSDRDFEHAVLAAMSTAGTHPAVTSAPVEVPHA